MLCSTSFYTRHGFAQAASFCAIKDGLKMGEYVGRVDLLIIQVHFQNLMCGKYLDNTGFTTFEANLIS